MKLTSWLGIIAVVLLAVLLFATFTYKEKADNLQIDKENLQKDLADRNLAYWKLADAFNDLRKQKTYSISLSPTIDTKISSVLGSSRQLTFQYYFTMDGNTIGLKPDSTIVLKK
jgi:hypothetical protein